MLVVIAPAVDRYHTNPQGRQGARTLAQGALKKGFQYKSGWGGIPE